MSIINGGYTQKGERAAMGGYLAQYDAFAIGVYDAMLTGKLEEIRVADMEENVGKLDDVVYVTHENVYAYQIKWTTAGNKMSYLDFKELIREVVEGWRLLKKLYPDKTILPYLLTNKSLSNGDYSIKSLVGDDAKGFADYEKVVLCKLKQCENIDTKWDNAYRELQIVTELTSEEWNDFWGVFYFLHDYKQEVIEIANAYEDQRSRDIIDIARMIQEMAGRKGFNIKRTVREIISHLGWSNRFKTKFDHNLVIPEELYVPNSDGIDILDKALAKRTKGYIFLKGTPGSGKSTLLTQWVKRLSNPFVRFYAFDFLNPNSQELNNHTRGGGSTFLHDIVHQIHNLGIEGNKMLLPLMDFNTLKKRFYHQLDVISQKFNETGISFVIVVDGLDHITREYEGCVETLMQVLPSPEEIPDGVIFVLGSQHFDHIGLNRNIEKASKNIENLLQMPPLCKNELEILCGKLLPKSLISNEVIDKCWAKSHGHPLFLRYLLNEIIVKGISILVSWDDTLNSLEDYYARIVGKHLEDIYLADSLGLISRIINNIHLDDVRLLCKGNAIMKIKNHMWHLFYYDEGGQTISFFHNSFRQYLLNRTAEDTLTGKYDKTKDLGFYKRLAEIFVKSWNYGYYLYKANEHDKFIETINPKYLYEQAQNYRPLWSLRRDIKRGVEIAYAKKDPYLLVRYLLLENQLNQMDNQDISVFSLTEEFIKTGRLTLAKDIVREGKLLHCTQFYAMNLAIEYFKLGDREEANILFELSYPDFLSHSPEEFNNHYHDLRNKEKYLEKWVKTAGYFYEWLDVEKYINEFILYLEQLAVHNNEEFDPTKYRQILIKSYLDSMIEQNSWSEFERLINLIPNNDENLIPRFILYKDAIIQLNRSQSSTLIINKYFVEAKNIVEILPFNDIRILIMAYLALEIGKPNEITNSYIEQVDWTKIGPFYQSEISQDFNTFNLHIFYIKARAYLGYNDEITNLVPDDLSNEDNVLLVNYARQVFSLAKLSGNAKRGDIDISFLSLLSASIRFFDNLTPEKTHNRYAYTIFQQRADFYEFVIEMTIDFGNEIMDSVVKIFEKYFSATHCGADSEARRRVIMTLFNNGYNREWCKVQLVNLDTVMMESKDVFGRVNEALQQGKAWLEFGCYDKTEQLFHQMIEESFGIGYRKDYQPTLFAEWIGDNIKQQPEHFNGRIHWLTSRLRYIDTISERKTTLNTANALLRKTLEYNLHSGLKLAQWLLDEKFDYFQSVNSTILKALLTKINNPKEYTVLFNFFTDIHLYVDDNCSYDIDSSLLEDFVIYGRKLLGDDFNHYEKILCKKIKTECSETISIGLLKSIEQISNSTSLNTNEKELRKIDEILIESQTLLNKGKKIEAWDITMKALEYSTSSGWVRFYDGGSRLKICKMLETIDEEKGYKFALNLFAHDIPGCYSYGIIQYLNEILPLISKDVDYKRLFKEEYEYMNRMLRENTSKEKDKPDVSPNMNSVCEVLRDWLLFIAEMPIMCISERAKMLLAKLNNETGLSIISVLPNNINSERLKLEIGCYMAELNSNYLFEYKETALKAVVSTNYQYRIYGGKILKALGIMIPQVSHKPLAAIYSMIFPKKNISCPLSNFDNNIVGINDVSSVMAVAHHWCAYLSYCTGIEEINLEYRAFELMKKYGSSVESRNLKDKSINDHYNKIGLRFPNRRFHAQAAIDGMFEVAAELVDSKNFDVSYDDALFTSTDFGNIHIETHIKPDFIQRLSEQEEWKVKDAWLESSEKSSRFCESLPIYEEMIVIGEYSYIKKMGDNPAIEEYKSTVSFNDTTSNSDMEIYGVTDYMTQMSDYLNMGLNDSEIILLRRGYYSDFSNKNHWIAFNPALAESLKWKPSIKGLFSWENEEGEIMVKSVYWQSGNINFFNYDHDEVGEGWLVVVSKTALETLHKVSDLYSHKTVTRRMGHDLNKNMSHSAYKVDKI